MSPDDERLVRCFQAVFPDLSRAAAATASSRTVDGWDSLQTVILMGVVGEEFDLDISPHEFPSLQSFAAIRSRVRQPV